MSGCSGNHNAADIFGSGLIPIYAAELSKAGVVLALLRPLSGPSMRSRLGVTLRADLLP